MLVAYKVVLPETGEKHIYDIDQYSKAVERWHEEIAWLDCDTYLVGLHVNEEQGDEQIIQWYLRDLPAWFSVHPPKPSRFSGVRIEDHAVVSESTPLNKIS